MSMVKNAERGPPLFGTWGFSPETGDAGCWWGGGWWCKDSRLRKLRAVMGAEALSCLGSGGSRRSKSGTEIGCWWGKQPLAFKT